MCSGQADACYSVVNQTGAQTVNRAAEHDARALNCRKSHSAIPFEPVRYNGFTEVQLPMVFGAPAEFVDVLFCENEDTHSRRRCCPLRDMSMPAKKSVLPLTCHENHPVVALSTIIT